MKTQSRIGFFEARHRDLKFPIVQTLSEVLNLVDRLNLSARLRQASVTSEPVDESVGGLKKGNESRPVRKEEWVMSHGMGLVSDS